MAASLQIPMVDGTTIHLPAGFRFSPSDEELMVHYLRSRALNRPLPSAIIQEADVTRSNPWDLVPEGADDKYFFAQKKLKYRVGTRVNRAAGEGYWRRTGMEAAVYGGAGELVGMKRTLVFYRGSPPTGQRTDWVMQEYRLAGTSLNPAGRVNGEDISAPLCRCAARAIAKKNGVLVTPDDSWVVSHIYKKKKRVIIQAPIELEENGAPFIDFLGEADREMSPTASCVTTTTSLGKDSGGSDKEAAGSNDN